MRLTTTWTNQPGQRWIEMTSEQQAANDSKPEDQALVAVGDPSLTLARKKLAGSAQCLNCGTELKGPFCYYCGQPDRNFMRFFPALLRDLMEDLLDLDSRFMRTIKPLMFKPGRLTRDYMDGRRFRYAPPMRLYIFSSIVFFLLAAFLSSDAITINGVENNDSIIQISTENADEGLEALGDVLKELPLDAQKQAEIEQIIAEEHSEESDEPLFRSGDISFNDEPWDRETNPVNIRWLPDWINDRINDEIEGSPQKAEQINENPNLIVDKVFDILPATMFVLLPVVALIFKFWYLFAQRYYVEHLIFSLHNHSFIFVSLIVILLANVASSFWSAHEYTAAATGAGWLITIISIWIPLYLLISLRVVYQQGWMLTIGKFFAVGLSYVTLLALVTSGVAITSFVLL
jgi:hypothetical protein